MDKPNYYTCFGCKQKPAYRRQEELAVHQKIFHENNKDIGKHQSGKTAQTLSELIKTRHQLQENILGRRQDLVELERMASQQQHSIRLLKDHIKQLEEAYQAVNLEIEKLKRIQKSVVKVEGGLGPSSRNTVKKSSNHEKQVANLTTQNAELLALVNSIKQTKSGGKKVLLASLKRIVN